MEVSRQWDDKLKVLKEKHCPPRILYPAKLSFKYKEEIKALPDFYKTGNSSLADLFYRKY